MAKVDIGITLTQLSSDKRFAKSWLRPYLCPAPKPIAKEAVDSFLLNLKSFSHAEAGASPAVAPVQDSSSELSESNSMKNTSAVMNFTSVKLCAVN